MEAEWFNFGPSGRGDGLRASTEVWDDSNTANSYGCKTPGLDGETSNNLILFSLEKAIDE